MKKYCSYFVLILFLFIGSTKIYAQTSNWVAPESSNNLTNPFKGNASATADGKKIFNQMCVLCHGLQGKGNGEAGLSLERKPANFLALKIINETSRPLILLMSADNVFGIKSRCQNCCAAQVLG